MTYFPQSKNRITMMVASSVVVFVLATVLSVILLPSSPFSNIGDGTNIAMVSIMVGLVAALGFFINRVALSQLS